MDVVFLPAPSTWRSSPSRLPKSLPTPYYRRCTKSEFVRSGRIIVADIVAVREPFLRVPGITRGEERPSCPRRVSRSVVRARTGFPLGVSRPRRSSPRESPRHERIHDDSRATH